MANIGVSLNRTNPKPLDADSVFLSEISFQEYLTNSLVKYSGQVVSVKLNNDTYQTYLIYKNTQNVWLTRPLDAGAANFSDLTNIIITGTYDEIKTLKTNSQLIPGQKYRIIYVFMQYLYDTETTFCGDYEYIILTALTTNRFELEVKSESYPDDIIHYNFDSPDARDRNFYYNSTLIMGYSGQILFRYDIIKNISTYYDFRNVVYGITCSKTFHSFPNRIRNVHIGKLDLDYAITKFGYYSSLNNILFETTDVYDTCCNIEIGENNYGYTLPTLTKNLKIGNNISVLGALGTVTNSLIIGDFYKEIQLMKKNTTTEPMLSYFDYSSSLPILTKISD